MTKHQFNPLLVQENILLPEFAFSWVKFGLILAFNPVSGSYVILSRVGTLPGDQKPTEKAGIAQFLFAGRREGASKTSLRSTQRKLIAQFLFAGNTNSLTEGGGAALIDTAFFKLH